MIPHWYTGWFSDRQLTIALQWPDRLIWSRRYQRHSAGLADDRRNDVVELSSAEWRRCSASSGTRSSIELYDGTWYTTGIPEAAVTTSCTAGNVCTRQTLMSTAETTGSVGI